jgi:hypothetical protein
MACTDVWVLIDHVEVIRAENLGAGIPFPGEPGSSAEWRLNFRIGGLNSNGQEFEIYKSNVIHGTIIPVNRLFTVPEPNPGENVVEVWGVEQDDTLADDSLPTVGMALDRTTLADIDNVVLHARGVEFDYKVYCRVRSGRRGILADTSDDGPGVVSWNGDIYVGWTGRGNQHVNVMNLRTFEKVTFEDTALGGVALSVYKNRLYLAWTKMGQANTLNLVYSVGGLDHWDPVVLPEESSIAAPSLASSGGALFISWTGTDNSLLLNLRKSDDGIVFAAKLTLDETSITSPEILGNTPNGIDLAWVGTDGEGLINSMAVSQNLAVESNSKITENELTDSPISTVYFPAGGYNAWYIAWRGVDGEGQINYMRRSFNRGGPDWKRLVNETTVTGPALLNHNGECLYLFWTGTDDDRHINYKLIDAS